MSRYDEEITQIRTAFEKIRVAVGKEKKNVVKDIEKNDNLAFEALRKYLDPSVVFHLGEKSLSKQVFNTEIVVPASFSMLCHTLSSRNGVSDNEIYLVQRFLSALDAENAKFAEQYLCKTYRIGITAKTLNDAVGSEVIPVMECMLANKYFEHQSVVVEGKEFTVTLKLDGIRCICLADASGVKFFSRQGQLIDGLVDIEREISQIFKRECTMTQYQSIVLDGELLVDKALTMESKTAYKLTTNIVRKNGEKHRVSYHVFDIIRRREFDEKKSTTPYAKRRKNLDTLFEQFTGWKHLTKVPVLYSGNDTSYIMKLLEIARKAKQEGVMVNLNDAPYDFKRTNNLLKCKVMQDCDLEIIGVQEGSGKFVGTTGALLCQYKGNPVGVGSGLSDVDRSWFWSHRDEVIGRVATIQYFEETVDANGIPSIRFPVFKELREIGKEVSYN